MVQKMELSQLIFSATTTELERASKVIGALVQDMSKVSAVSVNMAKIQAQTEAVLARAANDTAKARKENAKAADIEIKTVIAADKADSSREKSIRKTTEATESSTRAVRTNVDILQRQSDIYEFLAAGFSKGQSGILATAKATGQLTNELKGVLEAQKQFTSDSFDQSETGLKRLLKTTKEVTDAQRFFNEGANLTTKQARELSNDLDRLNASLTQQGKSYTDINKAQAIYKQQFLEEAAAVNKSNAALDVVVKQRREVVSATDYMVQAEQKLSAALNTTNAAIDRSGTDLLVKYETSLRKSGIAQDVATQKLAAYKMQLLQVQAQEEKRSAQHLARSLTPQISDVVVSLWSGQSPLTVLMQQGAQINDLFQLSGVKAEEFAKTVRNAFASMVPAMATVAKGVAGTITSMFYDAGAASTSFLSNITGISYAMENVKRSFASAGDEGFKYIGVMTRVAGVISSVFAVGVAVAAAALVGLGIGLKQVIQEEDALALSLAKSGGSLNISHTAAIQYAKGMRDVGVTTGQAIEVIKEMADAGNFVAKEIKMVTEAAVDMEKYAGVAVKDTVKEFSKLKEKPVEAILELAKTTGMIAPEVVKAVIELERQGKSADAVAKSMTALADVNKQKVQTMKDDYSSLALAVIGLKDAFSSLFSGIFKSMFYKDDPVTALRGKIAEAEANVQRMSNDNSLMGKARSFRLPEAQAELDNLREQLAVVLKTNLARQQTTEANVKGAKAEADTELLRAKHQGNIAKAEGEITKLKAQRAQWEKDGLLTAERSLLITQGIKEENKKIADELKKGAPKADRKLDSFYDDAVKKFRDATIEATDATDALTKSQIDLMQTTANPKFAALSEQKKLDILQSAAAAIAKEKEKEAVIELGKAEEFREKILGKSQGLGKQYYADMKTLEGFAASGKYTTEQIEEMTRKILEGTPVYQAYQKTLDRMTEALRKFTESSIAYQESTNAENQELDYRISLLGKTAEEQRKIQLEYQREIKLNSTRVELAKKLRDIDKERQEFQEGGGVDTKELQKFTDAEVQARQDAADRVKVINKSIAVEYASDVDKEFQKIKEGISDSIVSALFEGGKEGSKKLRNVLVDTLRKKVTIFVDAVVNTLIGNVVGSITGQGGGTGGGGDIMGSLQSAYSMLTKGVSGSIADGFAKFATSNAGQSLGLSTGGTPGWSVTGSAPPEMTSFGQNMGQVMGVIGDTLAGYAMGSMARSLISGGYSTGKGMKTFQDVGMAIGSAIGGPVVGAVIGAVSGFVNRAFGRKLKDSGIEGTFGGAAGFEGNSYEFYKGGWFRSDKTKRGELDGELKKYLTDTYKALQVQTGTFAQTLGLSADKVATFTSDIKLSLKGLDEKDAQAALEEAISGANEKLAQQILGTWEQVTKDVADVVRGQMGGVFASASSDGGAQEMYVPSEFAKEGEKASDTLKRLAVSLSAANHWFDTLGVTLMDVSIVGGATASKFIELFGSMDAFTTSASFFYENFYTEQERTAKLTASLTTEFNKLNVDLPKTREAYKNLVITQLEAGESGAEFAVKLMQLGPAFNELLKSTEEAEKALKDQLAKTLNDAYSAVEVAIKAQQEILKAQEGAQNEVVKNLQSVFDLLKKNVQELYNQVSTTSTMLASQGRAIIDRAIATGQTPEYGTLSEAISAVKGQIDTTSFTTQFDADKARLQLAGDLKILQDRAELQLTNEELILKGIKAQIEYLDDLNKSMKAQVDAALGIKTAVLTVSEAVNALVELLKPKTPEKTPVKSAFVSGPGGSSSSSSSTTRAADEAQSIRDYVGRAFGESTDFTDKNALSQISSMAYLDKWTLDEMSAALGVPAGDIKNLFAGAGLSHWSGAAFANGGAFTNGVVQQPTMFNTAQMGEAGPEAIMPLTNVGGRLGVSAVQNVDLEEAINSLNKNIEMLRAEVRADVGHNAKTANLLDRVIRDGRSLTVTTTAAD